MSIAIDVFDISKESLLTAVPAPETTLDTVLSDVSLTILSFDTSLLEFISVFIFLKKINNKNIYFYAIAVPVAVNVARLLALGAS